MITAAQLKQIQTLLNKRFTDRQERLEFLSDFFSQEIKSTKELTEQQAQILTLTLSEGKGKAPTWEGLGKIARFDKNNAQHRTILSRCHELGWVGTTESGKVIPDLNRLGGWLISKRSPVQKALLDMTKQELSKVIFALENMLKKKYKQ